LGDVPMYVFCKKLERVRVRFQIFFGWFLCARNKGTLCQGELG
jgi:hypothetical protein